MAVNVRSFQRVGLEGVRGCGEARRGAGPR